MKIRLVNNDDGSRSIRLIDEGSGLMGSQIEIACSDEDGQFRDGEHIESRIEELLNAIENASLVADAMLLLGSD